MIVIAVVVSALTLRCIQIIERFRRLGPARDVKVIKFVMKDTVEESLLILQKQNVQLSKRTHRDMTHEEERKACLRMIYEAFKMTPSADRARPRLRSIVF
jgi:hypothetical protein